MNTPAWCIDISYWQGNTVDFSALKQRGVHTVIVRLTYGKSADARGKQYVAAAKAAGLTVYAYGYTVSHYASVAGSDVEAAISYVQQEMDSLAMYMQQYSCDPVGALDMELADKGSFTNFTGAQLTQIANAGMARLQANGIQPIFYASMSWTIDRMGMTEPIYAQWPAYWVEEHSYFHNFPYSDGSLPNTRYGKIMQEWKNKGLLAVWQWGGGVPSDMGEYYGFPQSGGLDRDLCYLTDAPTPEPLPNEKGMQFITTIDVYASASQIPLKTKERFNVQVFTEPDVNSTVLTEDAAKGLPDGRYWCSRTGIKMEHLDGYEGAEIFMDANTKGYLVIIDGATEITHMPANEAHHRFVEAPSAHHNLAELQAIKNKFAELKDEITSVKAFLAKAEEKIKAAQAAKMKNHPH